MIALISLRAEGRESLAYLDQPLDRASQGEVGGFFFCHTSPLKVLEGNFIHTTILGKKKRTGETMYTSKLFLIST